MVDWSCDGFRREQPLAEGRGFQRQAILDDSARNNFLVAWEMPSPPVLIPNLPLLKSPSQPINFSNLSNLSNLLPNCTYSWSLGVRLKLPITSSSLTSPSTSTMQRALTSARSSALSSSSKLRATPSFSLQQRRFAHKVGSPVSLYCTDNDF